MLQSRRVTRSQIAQSRSKNLSEHGQRAPPDYWVVRQAIQNKDYDEGMKLIRQNRSSQHWRLCLKALIFHEKQQYRQAVKTIFSSFKLERSGCNQCFQLLLRILENQQSDIYEHLEFIHYASESEDLPPNIRSRYQLLLKSLINSTRQKNTQMGPCFHNLFEAYRARGAQFEKVSLLEISKDYRVAIAKDSIQPHQVIIFVPENQIITLQKAKQNRLVEKISKSEASFKSPKHCILSLFLILEKAQGESSSYFNYINSLPTDLDNFPIYYNRNVMHELDKTTFDCLLKRRIKDLKEDYQQILKILGQIPQLNLEIFIWARMIVCSRIFGILMHQIKTDALVPIADMLNHKMPKQTHWYFSDCRKGFIVKNMGESINQGQQIFDFYGVKCNSRFLLNYGFIQPNNVFNETSIPLRKIEFPRTAPHNAKLSTNLESEDFNHMISYFRKQIYLQAASKDHKRAWAKRKEMYFKTRELELKVWRSIRYSCTEKLNSYPTTIAFDERELRKLCLHQNIRNCIQIRLGQKRILSFYIRMAKKMISYFSNPNIGFLNNAELKPYYAYLKSLSETRLNCHEG